MNEDLKRIKKKYGEDMMHLCRDLFPTILEHEGLLSKLIEERFYPDKKLAYNIIVGNVEDEFKNYIYSYVDVEKPVMEETKTPKELLSEAGYDLYECNSEEDIQKFEKYYKKNERLCTFNGNRLERCHVFFAVKKNVDEIKRENFPEPKRQDEYGTSVISIQFSRGNNNTLSIKNRYNHTVNNPDSTFSNNLDNIIPGLTYSFEKYYNYNINSNLDHNFDLYNYVKASDGKFYRFNYEIDNIYYCPNNIIIDNFEPEKLPNNQILIDKYMIDLTNKYIRSYDGDKGIMMYEVKRIERVKNKETKEETIKIYDQLEEKPDIEIIVDEDNRIISYKNEVLTYIKDDFMEYNISLKTISLPNVQEIERNFLIKNRCIKNIYLPKVTRIGNNFLPHAKKIESSNFENLINVGNSFLSSCEYFTTFNANTQKMDNKTLYMQYLKTAGNDFLTLNKNIIHLSFPNLFMVDDRFFYFNRKITDISAPKLHIIGKSFLGFNNKLKKLSLPDAEWIEDNFLSCNECIEEVYLPNLESVGFNFLENNRCLKELSLPSIIEIECYFMNNNKTLESIDLPKVKHIFLPFLDANEKINKYEIMDAAYKRERSSK